MLFIPETSLFGKSQSTKRRLAGSICALLLRLSAQPVDQKPTPIMV